MINIDLLKKQKRKLKLTFDKIAEKSQISRRTVCGIFSGEIENPRIETIQAIEKVLGIESEPAEISESNKNL